MDAVPSEIGKWCLILCYPSSTHDCCLQRFTEMKLLGVAEIAEEGGAEVRGIRVVGKGTSSIVVKGRFADGREVAVKIRRSDSRRESLLWEAEALKAANKVGVGPRLYAYSRNFIVREYVEGVPIRVFAERNCGEPLRIVLLKLAQQLMMLDSIGLAHNELSRFEDHVLVSERELLPVIIDFESATFNPNRSNLTQFFSFLLKAGHEYSVISRCAGIQLPREALRGLLKRYKADRNLRGFLVELGLEL
ncbi:MAG: hypothetical protein QXM99_07925 [Thermofilum sp.]